MIRMDRKIGFALCLVAFAGLACAGEGARDRRDAPTTPINNPHTTQLSLDAKGAKKRAPVIEKPLFLDLKPGLAPMPFPKNTDVRARILTPELRRTPVVGWIATNLYRDEKDAGWCLEADPGEGEYIVFYRLHLK